MKPLAQTVKLLTAQQEISAIQQFSLLNENEYLSRLLSGRSSLPFDFSDDFQAAIFSDFLKGNMQARWRFLKRFGQEIRWRLFGKRPKYYIPFAGNRSYLLESVREHAWIERATPGQGPSYEEALKTWERFVSGQPANSYLRKLRPHGGKRGKLRVFVFSGGGGLGDAILHAPLLAALKEKLGGCEITLACPAAGNAFYARSSIVNSVISADWSETISAVEAAIHTDLFDLVVFSRCFIPVFQICAKTRITDPRLLGWLRTQQKTARMVEQFSTNIGISILDRMLNVHYLDLFGMVTGLPVSANSPIEFNPEPAALKAVKAFGLPRRYVTVRDGANPGDTAFVRDQGVTRTNKQLSPEKWNAILSWVKAQKIGIVQVGDAEDSAMPHVDRDLRGRTTLSELYFVMKGALTHIDTEGGLAHFARAVEKPSVIFFPTTSAAFFGYPQNLNISSAACGRCWYANDTWLAKCPRGTSGPECVTTMDIEPLKTFIMAKLTRKRAKAKKTKKTKKTAAR